MLVHESESWLAPSLGHDLPSDPLSPLESDMPLLPGFL